MVNDIEDITNANNQYQFNLALVIASLNPAHDSHLKLLQIGLEYAENIHLYIGTREKPDRLPYDLRVESARLLLENEGLEERVQLVQAKRPFELDGTIYPVVITGSDLLNVVSYERLRTKNPHVVHFTSFPYIISIYRKNNGIEDEAREILESRVSLIELPSISDHSSTEIRERYKEGEDIEDMMLGYIWNLIKDHIGIFKN